MKKMKNKITVEGYYYDDTLKLGNKGYITGKLNILTSHENDEMQNVCGTKVIAGPSYGNKPDAKPNLNFYTFKSLIEGQRENNYLKVGNKAIGIQINGQLSGNHYIPQGTQIKRENVISSVNNMANFITLINSDLIDEPQATFDVDTYITSIIPEMTKATELQPSVETGNILVKGYVFDFKNTAIPITFVAKPNKNGGPSAAMYFTSMANKVPFLTEIRGNINNYIMESTRTEPSAWGEPYTVSFKTTKKEYEINWAMGTPYEDGITPEEFNESLQRMETEIAISMDKQKNQNQNVSSSPIGSDNASMIAAAFGNLSSNGNEPKFTF